MPISNTMRLPFNIFSTGKLEQQVKSITGLSMFIPEVCKTSSTFVLLIASSRTSINTAHIRPLFTVASIPFARWFMLNLIITFLPFTYNKSFQHDDRHRKTTRRSWTNSNKGK